MAFQTDFSNNEYGQILKKAYEDEKDPRIVQTIESYLSHNDYLQLKNELISYAKEKQGTNGAVSGMYTSLP